MRPLELLAWLLEQLDGRHTRTSCAFLSSDVWDVVSSTVKTRGRPARAGGVTRWTWGRGGTVDLFLEDSQEMLSVNGHHVQRVTRLRTRTLLVDLNRIGWLGWTEKDTPPPLPDWFVVGQARPMRWPVWAWGPDFGPPRLVMKATDPLWSMARAWAPCHDSMVMPPSPGQPAIVVDDAVKGMVHW